MSSILFFFGLRRKETLNVIHAIGAATPARERVDLGKSRCRQLDLHCGYSAYFMLILQATTSQCIKHPERELQQCGR